MHWKVPEKGNVHDEDDCCVDVRWNVFKLNELHKDVFAFFIKDVFPLLSEVEVWIYFDGLVAAIEISNLLLKMQIFS